MKYSNDIVEKAVARLESGEVSQRELDRVLRIPRKTLARWLNRVLSGQPARLKRRARKVWNKTVQPVLNRLRALLEKGKSSALAWIALEKVCLLTVQRYKKLWFPPKPTPKIKCKRYERKHAFSLMHTDWARKRILNGVRCYFSFYEDDASRKLFALKAYERSTLSNTIDNPQQAKRETCGLKPVLTDNGRQHHKNFDACLGNIKNVRTRVHNPKCNGKAEPVVKKVKRYLNKLTVRDLEHANRLLSRFQREYNNTPHSSLKYLTPNQVFSDKQKDGVICVVT